MFKIQVLFIPAFLFLFASCTKEAVLDLDHLTTPDAEIVSPNNDLTSYMKPTELSEGGSSVLLTVVSSTVVSGEYRLTLSGLVDPANTELASNQSIQFDNGTEAGVSISFSVNSHSEIGGNLQVNLDLGGQSLAGLTIDGNQYVIIVEDVIN